MKRIFIISLIILFSIVIFYTSLTNMLNFDSTDKTTIESIYSQNKIFTEAKFSGNTDNKAEHIVIISKDSWKQGCEEDKSCLIPHNKAVNLGNTILFLNEDEYEHNLRIRGESSYLHHPTDVIRQNEYFVYKFNESGKYDYYCTLHPWMEGIITVNQ